VVVAAHGLVERRALEARLPLNLGVDLKGLAVLPQHEQREGD